MVITRSHINEQISKGGKKMVTRPRRNLADIAKREWQLKQQRKRAKKARGMKTQDPVKHMRKKSSAPKKPTPDILKGKVDKTIETKKSIEEEFGDKQPGLKDISAKKDKPKIIQAGGQRVPFGSKEMKEKYIPRRVKRKAGGGVVMQKVRKYNEGGTVVHDQSTIKNL